MKSRMSFLLGVLLATISPAPIPGAIFLDTNPGASAPPATLGPYTMTSLPLNNSDPPPGSLSLTTVPSFGGYSLLFNLGLEHRRADPSSPYTAWVPSVVWGHGHTGDAYVTPNGVVTLFVTLPPGTRAFYFYLQPDPDWPNLITNVVFNLRADGDSGTFTGSVTVDKTKGAGYVGFYESAPTNTLRQVRVDSAFRFAIGEFGIAGSFPPTAQNLIVNGSFEFPPDPIPGISQTFPAGSTDLPGWTVINDTVERWMNGTSDLHTPHGSFGFDLKLFSNNPGGGIAQSIATSIGQVYHLSLDLSRSPNSSRSFGVNVTAGSNSTFLSYAHQVPGNHWVTYGFDFTAQSESTLITLTGFGPNVSYIGLDNVSVTPLVPIQSPTITVPLRDQTNCVNGAAGFNITAVGAEPLSYRWYFNGTNLLTEETSAQLNLMNLQPGQGGSYSVIVSNAFGSVNSAPARLVVLDPCLGIHLFPGLSITGVVGRTYTLEYVTNANANDWTSIATNTLSQPVWRFIDTNSPFDPKKFFRARLLP